MFWIVTCFMYPRVLTKEGSCGDCCLMWPQLIFWAYGPVSSIDQDDPGKIEKPGEVIRGFGAEPAEAEQVLVIIKTFLLKFCS